MVEKTVKKLENNNVEEPKGVMLEGVLMPNGEFIHKGKSIWIDEDSKVFIDK